MKKIYGEENSKDYHNLVQNSTKTNIVNQKILETISTKEKNDSDWIDLACGTGRFSYFLRENTTGKWTRARAKNPSPQPISRTVSFPLRFILLA